MAWQQSQNLVLNFCSYEVMVCVTGQLDNYFVEDLSLSLSVVEKLVMVFSETILFDFDN